MLNDLKNCGVKDVLFFCVDRLAGFKEAIGAVYPQSRSIGAWSICCAIPSNMWIIMTWRSFPLTSRRYTMRQIKRLPCQNLMQPARSGGRNTLTWSVTGKITGRMWALFSSFRMISAALCTRQILLRGWTASTGKSRNPKVYSPMIRLWKNSFTWSAGTWQKSGPRGTGTGTRYSTSWSSCTGSVLRIIYRKRKRWNSSPTYTAVPAKPYSIGICSISKNPQTYSGGRVWAAPAELTAIQTPFYGAKKSKINV